MTEKRVIAIVGSSNAALIAAALRQPPSALILESAPCKSFTTADQHEKALDRACVAAVAAELGV